MPAALAAAAAARDEAEAGIAAAAADLEVAYRTFACGAAAALARAVWRRARKSGEEAPDCCVEAEAPCKQVTQLRKSPRLKSS